MARRPTLLTSTPLPTEPSDILFWSGGKDSFLTYLTLATTETPTVLLTTYDSQTGIIANQDHHIDQVIQQASHLGLSLIGVPLQPHVEFNDLVYPALELVPQISSLVFGDLHLEHIRSWREQNFAPLQYPLQFPLWHAEYDELLTRLEISGVPCVISAVTEPAEPYLTVGTLFSRASMAALPPHIDRFGENGEFHTLAKVWEAPSLRGGE